MTAVSIDWAPLLPWELIGLLAVPAVLLIAFSLYRRALGVGWRALLFAVLLVTLANPSLVEEQREPLDDVVLVVVDDSQSQRIENRQTQTDEALAHLLTELNRLPQTDVRVVRSQASNSIDGSGTRLFQPLRKELASVARQRLAGIFLVSDGQVHDVPEDIAALDLDVPAHLLLTGTENEGDRRLRVLQAPSFAIVGKPVSLNLLVEDLGVTAGPRQAEIVLKQDGEEKQRLFVPLGIEQEIEFQMDRRGRSVLELEVEAGPQELTLANNRAAVEVNGVRERLRVLLVSGEPHAGERAWRNILKSDPSVDLVHFTILRPPEKQDGTPIRELSLIAFPTRELFEVKLPEFDLIIFDRYRRRGVLPSIYLRNIADYVDNGGALLEAVGPTFATPLSLYRTPLGRVLPSEPTGTIFEQGFRPAVTDLGERHPVTATLPGAMPDEGEAPDWGRWFRQIDGDRLRGDVLMSGVEDRPLLILDKVGRGRVAQLMSDHMWLWSRGFDGGGPHAELLRRVAHWLMREPDLEEEDLRATVTAGRLEIARRSLSPEGTEVTVTFPSGKSEAVTLESGAAGLSNGTLPVDEVGLYRISDGELTTLAAAGPINPLEFQDLRSTAELLRPLLDTTEGTAVRLTENAEPKLRKVRQGRDRHGRGWLGVVGSDAYVVTGVSRIPVLPALLVLCLALGTALAAWYREGR